MLALPEKHFPLRVLVCDKCWLVQTEDFASADELFDADYAYFSGFSTAWLAHSERYVKEMTRRFGLGPPSHVVEVAANDGYLLQYFKADGIPVTGIEPTASTAAAARSKGIDIVERFFGTSLADELCAAGRHADLTVANNVLAHVPDINDFVAGFGRILKPGGVATFEFPHLLNLVESNQFDTIYHEHFSYLSFTATIAIFAANGLAVFDVEEHPTHGGSLRVFAQRSDSGNQPVSPAVGAMLAREAAAGMATPAYYAGFQKATEGVKDGFLRFLLDAKEASKSVAAYGAAAKGNTLMNFAGIRPDLISFVVDQNPAKQGKHMPGSWIPIVGEDHLKAAKPDYIVILPWNLRTEVLSQLAYAAEWGASAVVAVPALDVTRF
jgi:SAM-dependent methyltransferase